MSVFAHSSGTGVLCPIEQANEQTLDSWLLQVAASAVLAIISAMKSGPGQRFSALRAERGYTQKTLADAMSPVRCTDQSISDFETGVSTRMRLTRWYRIAAVFRMSIEDLNRMVFGNTAGRLPNRAAEQRTVRPPPTPSSDQFADQALMSMTKNELKWLLIRVLRERERRGLGLISAEIAKKFPALGER